MNKQTLGLMLVIAAVAFSGAFIGGKRPALVERVVEKTFGASPGPDRFSPCESRNGIEQCFNRFVLQTATTTICAIQGPAATSTLVNGSVRMTTSSTSASVITFARATTAFATTTLIGNQVALAAETQATLIASSTDAQRGNAASLLSPITVFPPNAWFTIGMSGNIGTFSPVGTCSATFEVL